MNHKHGEEPMKANKHSPLPWKECPALKATAAGIKDVVDIFSADGNRVLLNLTPADRERIVRSVNALPGLLEAAENIENDDGRIPAPLWAQLQAAIANARGDHGQPDAKAHTQAFTYTLEPMGEGFARVSGPGFFKNYTNQHIAKAVCDALNHTSGAMASARAALAKARGGEGGG